MAYAVVRGVIELTKFDKLKQHIAREYEKKGMSHEEAEKIGAETVGN